MTAKVELLLEGETDHLRLVWQTGETLLDSIPFDDDPEGTRYNVLLAVQEMVTNVLRHGYGEDGGLIKVCFEATDEVFEVKIMDRGRFFNPLGHDFSEHEEEVGFPVEAGGYGILIATAVMDQVGYDREDDWNILSLSKRVHAGVTSGSESQV